MAKELTDKGFEDEFRDNLPKYKLTKQEIKQKLSSAREDIKSFKEQYEEAHKKHLRLSQTLRRIKEGRKEYQYLNVKDVEAARQQAIYQKAARKAQINESENKVLRLTNKDHEITVRGFRHFSVKTSELNSAPDKAVYLMKKNLAVINREIKQLKKEGEDIPESILNKKLKYQMNIESFQTNRPISEILKKKKYAPLAEKKSGDFFINIKKDKKSGKEKKSESPIPVLFEIEDDLISVY